MTDHRRRLIRAIGFGGLTTLSLPHRWTTPVVDAVLLPAHAQTTTNPTDPPSPERVLTFVGPTSDSVTLPDGVEAVILEVFGAAGGNLPSGSSSILGGLGGSATARFSVPPNAVLTIEVGGAGQPGGVVPSAGSGLGGSNGGGRGGVGDGGIGGSVSIAGGGGGGSDVAINGTLVIAAGGGGGAGGASLARGGDGGGLTGEDGGQFGTGVAAGGGAGGTQASGGAGGAGAGDVPGESGEAGSSGNGGDGGDRGDPGGGGGGGYFGGGGGGSEDNTNQEGQDAGGGGGGSGFIDGSGTDASFATGVRAGDGLVIVTYVLP